MNYDEFIKEVEENIKGYLPDTYKDAELKVRDVQKNNGIIKKGLTIRMDSKNVSPTIYLEESYDMYKNGYEMEECMEQLGELITNADGPGKEINDRVDTLFNKENIIPMLINANANEEMLKVTPHKMMNDLAVVFRSRIHSGDHVESFLINYDTQVKFGMNTDEMMKQAQENILRTGYTFESLDEIILNMMCDEVDPEMAREMMGDSLRGNFMYVLSNKDKVNGAGVLACPEVMEQVAEKVGGDFTILPSSIHELIIVPDTALAPGETPDTENLCSMVEEVNREAVGVEERLSNNVYRYDTKNKTVNMCMPEPVKDMNITK